MPTPSRSTIKCSATPASLAASFANSLRCRSASSYPTSNLINKLVLENLKHRPIRTLLSTIAIGIQVTMVLTLVGLSEGLLQDQADRTRGIGADLMVRAPGSSILSFSTAMPAGILKFVRKQPHVAFATGVLIQPAGGLNSVTGLNLDEFTRLGGFRFVSGGPFQQPNDVIVDTFYAAQHKT